MLVAETQAMEVYLKDSYHSADQRLPHIDVIEIDTEDESDQGEPEDSKKTDNFDSKCHKLLYSTKDVPINTWKWATNLHEACALQIKNEPNSTSGNINGFYNPKFARHLKNLLPYFPLFSEIMLLACGRGSRNATSAAVESEFNDLKNRTLINVQQPLRADRFVATHILSWPGKIKLALAGQSEKDALIETEQWNQVNGTGIKKRNYRLNEFEREVEGDGHKKKIQKMPRRSYSPDTLIIIGEDTSDPKYSDPPYMQLLVDVIKLPEDLVIQPVNALEESIEQSVVQCVQTSPNLTMDHSYEDRCEPVRHHPDDFRNIGLEAVNSQKKLRIMEHQYSSVTEPDMNINHTIVGHLQILPLDETCESTKYDSDRKQRRLPSVKTDEILDLTKEAVIELKEQHTWRNKNKPSKRLRYTKACPNFDSSNIKKYTSLPLLPNGNLCKNVHDKSTIFVVRNTCGFDSMCQYKCIDTFIQKGIVSQIFKERATVLFALPQLTKEINGDIITIQTGSNIATLVEYLFPDIPSYVLRCNCLQCGIKTRHSLVFLDVNYNPLSKGISHLHEAVSLGRYVPEKCCGMIGTQAITYGPHLFIDVDTGNNEREALRNVPQNLTITDGTQYKLAGVIEYQGPKLVNSLGHYIAHCWTGSHWIRYNDNARNKMSQTVTDTTTIEIHVCIYTI